MRLGRSIWFVVGVAAAIVAGVLITKGPPRPAANPPGTFSFAVLGDAPYYPLEHIQYPLVLQDIDAHDLRWVIHVGDILGQPCSDKRYAKSIDWFNGLQHPVIYTPGDNEWTDCWSPGAGRFAPRERLDRIRRVFFADPSRSLGGRPMTLVSQAHHEPLREFVENARWSHERVVFSTVHLVGSENGREPFPGRAAPDDDEVKRRTEAATAWVREAFAEARTAGASAVVIAFHGNPSFEKPAGDPYRQAYEPFMTALEEEVEQFGKPVLATHGDHHVYTVDHPLVRRTTGRRLDNFTRLQVPGSPEVGWVRVVVTPGGAVPFAFESRVVPRWKYW